MSTRTVAVVVVLPVLLVATQAYAQMGPAKVVTATAEMKPLPATITVVGTVEPVTRSVIAAEVAELVVDMPVRQGDLVEKGQLICKLKDATLALRLARDEARLAARKARLDELVNGTRSEELARLKAEYEAAIAIAEKWGFELARVKKLYGDEYANAKEHHDTVGEQLAAQARMLAAKAAYELGVAGERAEVIAQARYAVAEQQAVVDEDKADLAKTEIRAPFSGFVVHRYAEVGQWVQAGGDVVEMADLSSVLVRIDVPEEAIPFATVGSRADVCVDALKTTFQGKIKHVIPQADQAARTFPVEIEVPNTDYALKAGMFARATIVSGPAQPMVAVPKDAVSTQMGASFIVMVVPGQGGQMMGMPTPVTVGLDIDDWIAITSGNVPPGAQVVVRGNEMIALMMAPALVEIVPPAPK